MDRYGSWRILAAVLLALACTAGWAQTQGGSIQGKVTDAAGQPVAGALVQVSGPKLQGYQGVATDLEGAYMIPFLPIGTDYQVKVEAAGYNRVIRKGIEVQLGATVNLPFVLSQGQTEVVVTAAAPLINTKSTEVGADISDKMINAIPLGRSADGISFLAPGAVSSGIAGTPSFSGASGPENSYTVNGVDVTGSQAGVNITALNFDFIEATEVKTGGMDAEYGALMGGNITSVTKSGGNEFHGSLFVYYFDDSLGAKDQPLDNPSAVDYRQSFKQYDIGGTLGGYLVKDKLWFFVAYDYNDTQTGYGAGADGTVTFNGHPAYSWAAGTGYTNKETNPMYAAKLTWNINQNHKLALSYFGNNDKLSYYRNLDNPSPVSSAYTQKADNYAISLQWNATWTPKFFTEAIISRRDTKFSNLPNSALARDTWGYSYQIYRNGSSYTGYDGLGVIPIGPPNSYDPNTGAIDLSSWRASTGGQILDEQWDTSDQLRLKGTNLFSLWGRHELSYGLQVYDITYRRNFNETGPAMLERNPGDPFYGQSTSGGVVVRWAYDPTSPSNYTFLAEGYMNPQDKHTKQTYTAYWAQDNWDITDHFMLKLGVRLDQIHMKGQDLNMTVPRPWYPDFNGRGHELNINDEWAPRIGFTWDVAHNNKSKLYGFWGWYFERIPQDLAVRVLTDEYRHFSTFYDAALTQSAMDSYTFGPEYIQGGPSGGPLKGAYNEEYILGYQYEVRPDFTVGVRGVYRDIGRIIEDISMDGASTYIMTNPDQWTNIWVPDAAGRPGYRYHFPKPVRIYKALEVTAEKRFSNHWLLQASYVLSRLEGNYEGMYLSGTTQLDPNLTSIYDIPSLLVNGYGLLPNDRTHVLKAYGGYFFDNIPLELSGNFTLASGTPISAMGADAAYGLNTGFAKQRGTAGRTPTVWSLDLGAQYTFKIFKSNLALRADIFNVTNNQVTTAVDQTYNTVNTDPHQNYPYFKMQTAHQEARRIRLALRWSF